MYYNSNSPFKYPLSYTLSIATNTGNCLHIAFTTLIDTMTITVRLGRTKVIPSPYWSSEAPYHQATTFGSLAIPYAWTLSHTQHQFLQFVIHVEGGQNCMSWAREPLIKSLKGSEQYCNKERNLEYHESPYVYIYS